MVAPAKPSVDKAAVPAWHEGFLAVGHSTGDVARRFGLSVGRISQK